MTGHPDQLATFVALRPPPSEDELRLHHAASSEMPLTNLCNQLVVIGTRRICRLSNVRLSPFRPPLPTCALDSTPSRRGRHRAFHGGTGSPQAATQLRARTRLVPRSWLRPFSLSPFGVLGFPERNSRRPIESCASREHVASDASCRAPSFARTAPGSPKGARAFSTHHAPTW